MMSVKTQLKTKAAKEGEVDRVYRMLKAWLIECVFPPGEFLTEMDLAGRCETSRTPIREACNRLAQDGWMLRHRHRGYQVAPVSIKGLLETYEYRKILECFTTEKVAQIASNAQLDELRHQICLEEDRSADVQRVIDASDAFHLGIANIAGNQKVIAQLKLTLEYLHRFDRLSAQKELSWIPHGEILSALESRRPAEARHAMATHIDYARDRMLRLFAP
jgi:DNA-binding GntR family transcriptional regulator